MIRPFRVIRPDDPAQPPIKGIEWTELAERWDVPMTDDDALDLAAMRNYMLADLRDESRNAAICADVREFLNALIRQYEGIGQWLPVWETLARLPADDSGNSVLLQATSALLPHMWI